MATAGAVADKKHVGPRASKERRGCNGASACTRGAEGKKDDQKLEEEIGRDEDQLEDERGHTRGVVEGAELPGQLDKAGGEPWASSCRAQPRDIPCRVSLREVEREQEDGKYGKARTQ